MSNSNQKSKGQILKSSAVIGSSTAVTMVMGLVRQKAIALLLGTGGGGLWAMSWSLAELARGVAGMGISNSGVRQIAESVGTGDEQRIARTAIALRRISFVLGAIGAVLLIALCVPLGRLSFKDDKHAFAVALLAVTVLLSIISQGQTALIQGMRRIGDLAKINIIGAVAGTLLAIPIVYFFRERGIVPALIAVSLATLCASWWFARRVKIAPVQMTTKEVWGEASGLLRLGFLFMVSGLMTLGVSYVVNVILRNKIDEHAVGLYNAAWVLGGYFSGFIVQAMGADFYPRLTAVANDNKECNRIVNEQVEVGLLMAGPGLIATLVFAPLAIRVVHTAAFLPAVPMLRWFCLGMLMRVIIWPVGFVLMAKNAQRLFFFSELFANALYATLVWFCVGAFKVSGVGVAFVGLCVIYAGVVYTLVRRLSGFRWSSECARVAISYSSLAAGVFAAFEFLPEILAWVIGIMVLIGVTCFSTKMLCALVPPERFPRPARQLLTHLRLLPVISKE